MITDKVNNGVSQILCSKETFLPEIYKDALKSPYSYVDLKVKRIKWYLDWGNFLLNAKYVDQKHWSYGCFERLLAIQTWYNILSGYK